MRVILVLLLALTYASSVNAYTGPGLGLGLIGTIVGVLFSLLLAVLAIFWYPLKRLLKTARNDTEVEDDSLEDDSLEEEPQQAAKSISDSK